MVISQLKVKRCKLREIIVTLEMRNFVYSVTVYIDRDVRCRAKYVILNTVRNYVQSLRIVCKMRGILGDRYTLLVYKLGVTHVYIFSYIIAGFLARYNDDNI